MHVQQMRTLLNDRDLKEVLSSKVRPDSQRCWGSMSGHQMICHLSDSFRVAWRKARQFFLDALQAYDLQVGGSLGASQVAARHQDTT
jgi:hypothetical protein